MANKWMHIPNDGTQKYPFCILQLVMKRLDTQVNELNNQNSIKDFKVFNQRIRKRY